MPLRLLQAARVAGTFAAVVPCAALIGWSLDIEVLRAPVPGTVSMNPTTALGLFLSALALLLATRDRPWMARLRRVLALAVLAIGLAKLSDLLFATHLRIDEHLFAGMLRDHGLQGLLPSRMAPNVALNFVLAGVSLVLLPARRAALAVQCLASAATMLSLLALMGYLYGVKPLYGVLNYIPMAVHTSLCFLALCFGLFSLYPERGATALLRSGGSGGFLARRLFPAVVLVPAFLGWIKLMGEKAGWFDPGMGLALVMLLTMAGLAALVYWSTTLLDRMDRARDAHLRTLEEAKRAAEAASLAKSQFLANMSHELRTPLNSILGFTHILLKNKGGNLREPDLNFLGRVHGNGKHLLGLINDILDISKVEAGGMEVSLAPCRLDELVRDTLARLEGQTGTKDLRLVPLLPERLEPLATDEGMLRQILINLVGNAVKFTERGQVRVRVEASPEGRALAIRVEDTGPGIPPDRLEAIFEAFQQADNTYARAHGGTGLGLTLSRSFCRLLGYALEVQSEVDKGSVFTIRLA